MTRPVYTPLDGTAIIGTDELASAAVTDPKVGVTWTDLSIINGFTATNPDLSDGPRYARLGTLVHFYGTVTRGSGNPDFGIFGVLPAGYRPIVSAGFPGVRADTLGATILYINTAGECSTSMTGGGAGSSVAFSVIFGTA